MYGYIYLTENLINGKKYIGQHRSEKFDESYLGSGKILVAAIEKYGKENFSCKILVECDSDDELNLQEKLLIAQYNAVESDEFYNIANGGLGHTCDPWNKGKRGVQPVTQKQLDALEQGRHRCASEKQKQVLREYRKSFVPTEETSKKLSIAGAKANKNKKAMNNGIYWKYFSKDEIEQKLAEGWKIGKLKKS